jgi:hypothetical protein
MLLLIGGFWPSLADAALEAHLLTGDTWQSLSRDTKIAYIWGIGNVAELERINQGTAVLEPSSAERKSVVPYLIRGLSGISIDEVVNRIDSYYLTHPDQRNEPVIEAILQSIVLPRLRSERVGGSTQ